MVKKRATKLYIVDRKYLTNLHNYAQWHHMLEIQSTDMGVSIFLHNEIMSLSMQLEFILSIRNNNKVVHFK